MATQSQAKELFRRAEAVCFDVDSTVIREEGIDELAKFCGVGDAVTEMCVATSDSDLLFLCFSTLTPGFLLCATLQDSQGYGRLDDIQSRPDRASVHHPLLQGTSEQTDHRPPASAHSGHQVSKYPQNVFAPQESERF